MGERGPLPLDAQPFPSAIRENTRVPIYTETKEVLPPNIKHILHKGVQPFGSPPYLAESLAIVREGEIENLETYSENWLDPAENFIYNWYGLNKNRAHVAFGNRGSYGLLMDIFFNMVKSPNQGKVRVLDVGVDFPAAYKATQRYDAQPPPDNESPRYPVRMPFYSVPMNIDNTFDQTLESAIDTVDQYSKRKFTGFAVVLSVPNSPKGSRPSNNEGIRELAYLTAKNGYTLIIDEAFNSVLSPNDSVAAELTENYKNVIVVSSASKELGIPNARLGWAIMSSELEDSFEGTRTEFDIGTPTGQIATALFNPQYEQQFSEHLSYVHNMTPKIKVPFVNGLTNAGLNVFETDSHVPIFFVDGLHEGFCNALEQGSGPDKKDGIKVARGSTFNKTYRPKIGPRSPWSPARSEVLTDQYARVTIPRTLDEVEEIIQLFEAAAKKGRAA